MLTIPVVFGKGNKEVRKGDARGDIELLDLPIVDPKTSVLWLVFWKSFPYFSEYFAKSSINLYYILGVLSRTRSRTCSRKKYELSKRVSWRILVRVSVREQDFAKSDP